MVEVDVRQEQVPHVGELEPVCAKAGAKRLDGGGRPAVEERRPVGGLDHVDADHALVAEVPEVDRLGPGRGVH